MGTSFRKSVKIAPGIKLNFSKRGVSTSIGPKGAKINVSKRGTYLNTSIPGTGIYNRQKISGSSNKRQSTQPGCMVFLSILFSIITILGCSHRPGIEEKLPIPKDFTPTYKIITDERLDYEWDGLDIMRRSYRITLPKSSYDEIKNNCRALAIKTYKDGVYNVSIFVYNDASETNNAYTVAMYEFCPYGDWSRTNEMYSTKLQDFRENFKTR